MTCTFRISSKRMVSWSAYKEAEIVTKYNILITFKDKRTQITKKHFVGLTQDHTFL